MDDFSELQSLLVKKKEILESIYAASIGVLSTDSKNYEMIESLVDKRFLLMEALFAVDDEIAKEGDVAESAADRQLMKEISELIEKNRNIHPKVVCRFGELVKQFRGDWDKIKSLLEVDLISSQKEGTSIDRSV